MKKPTAFLVLVFPLIAAILTGCGSPYFSGIGKGVLYGRVYNGLTRAAITSATNTNLSGKLTYYNVAKNEFTAINAAFSGEFFYFKDVPTYTDFVMELSDGSNFRKFVFESTGISETREAPGGTNSTWFLEANPSMFGYVYLFPANVNPGDVTIHIIDEDNGATIGSSGTVELVPTAVQKYNNMPTTETAGSTAIWSKVFPNVEDITAPAITGTFVNGSVTIPGTSLTLGIKYTVKIHGVAGYDGISDKEITPMSTSPTTEKYELPEKAKNLAFSTANDVNSLGKKIPVGYSVTLYFNQGIELDPNTPYTAEISGVTNVDIDDDGTASSTTVAPFNNTVNTPTPVASNHLAVTVTGNALTITLKAGCFSREDTADDLVVRIKASSIGIRAKGATSRFQTLDAFVGSTYEFIVRNSTSVEEL